MRLIKGHDYQTLPEAVEEHTASLVIYPNGDPERFPASYAMQMQWVPFHELQEMKAKQSPNAEIRGVPAYWAIGLIENRQRLFVWPTPVETTFARFRYCPAMKEI